MEAPKVVISPYEKKLEAQLEPAKNQVLTVEDSIEKLKNHIKEEELEKTKRADILGDVVDGAQTFVNNE